MNGLTPNLLEDVLIGLIVLLALLFWFFVNRASVRANEQIKLLQDIVKLQKQQIALLKALAPAPEVQEPAKPEPQEPKDDDEFYFKDMIPER